MDARRPTPGSEATDSPRAGHDNEPPPLLGSWRALYAVVVGELLLVIALCDWLARWGR